MTTSLKNVPILSRWRHYKTGDIYTVRGLSIREDDQTIQVIYQPDGRNVFFNRPMREWFERMEDGRQRFTETDDPPPDDPGLPEPPKVNPSVTPIDNHEGKKYLRLIHSAKPDNTHPPISVDVYAVIEAFGITCPAMQHAAKKILCAGLRGKGTAEEDIKGAIAALNRAIEMERNRRDKK